MGLLHQKDKNAGLYARKGQLFIQPYHRTTDGVLVGAAPVAVLEQSVSDKTLGEALRETLTRSGRTVPHPTDWNTVPQPLNEAAGVKTWSTFVKGTKGCEIGEEGDIIKITPTRNAGARDGFLFLKSAAIEVSSRVDNAQLGSALRLALSSAE